MDRPLPKTPVQSDGYETLVGPHKKQADIYSTAPAGPAPPAPQPIKLNIEPEYLVPGEMEGRANALRMEESVLDISKEQSEQFLYGPNVADGDFVIRKSRSHPGSFVIVVFFCGSAKHYPVELLEAPYEGLYSLICPGNRKRFKSLSDVVDHYKARADGIATTLRRRIR